MNFSDLVGLSSEIQLLMRSVKAGRIGHAYLISGAKGSGKKTLANLFVQALFCTGEDRPCGSCPACKRYLSGMHPDAHILRPEGKSISVEEVRLLIEKLSRKPYEGDRHAVIIEQADKMTVSAQNALLKTLESPPGSVVFFLLTDTPTNLLVTVRSRCVPVKMPVLSEETIRDLLARKGVPAEKQTFLAGWAMGSAGRALEAAEGPAAEALMERVLSSVRALKGPETVSCAAGMLVEEKDVQEEILNFLELLSVDLIRCENGLPTTVFSLDAIRQLRLDPVRLGREVMLARQEIASNVSFQSVLEKMYYALAGGLSR